jgi:hypothetical protein
VVNANSAVTNVNTNLVVLFAEITRAIEGLAGITSNLNAQVQRNDNLVSSISKLIVDSDDMVQGLKRHWLLRSAFKEKDREQRSQPSRREPARPTDPKGGGKK